MDIDFEKLIKLQALDTEIKNTTLFLQNIPRQIENISKKIANSLQVVQQAKEKLVQNQKKRRNRESEVKDIKAKISRYNLQLNQVKTNVEYRALLREIEEAQQKVNEMEEEIITEMLNADEIEEEIKQAARKHNEEEQKLASEKELLQQKNSEREARMKMLIQEKEELIKKIPSDLSILYLKIFDSKSGLALSPVYEEFCSLCHMRIRPQMLNEIKGNEKIILCENCGRILYWAQESA